MRSNKQINDLQTNCSADKFLHLPTALELLRALRLGNFSCLKFKPVLLCEEQICKSRGRKGDGSVSRASHQWFSWSLLVLLPLVLWDKGACGDQLLSSAPALPLWHDCTPWEEQGELWLGRLPAKIMPLHLILSLRLYCPSHLNAPDQLSQSLQ